MALLKYDKDEYVKRHAFLQNEREVRTARKLAALFKRYAGEVHSGYLALGFPVFPSETQDTLRNVLMNEYTITAGSFSDFHDPYLTVPFANQGKAHLRTQDALSRILPQLALIQSDRIIRTIEGDLMNAVEKARDLSPNVGSRMLEATYVHGELIARSNAKARMIAATETTRVAEISKDVGMRSTISELEEEEIVQAFGEDLSEDEMDAALALGGAAAIAAGLLLVSRTWNSVLDGNTRISHAAANGQEAVGEATFDVGGEALSFPGDPAGSAGNTVNCRCFLAYSI